MGLQANKQTFSRFEENEGFNVKRQLVPGRQSVQCHGQIELFIKKINLSNNNLIEIKII